MNLLLNSRKRPKEKDLRKAAEIVSLILRDLAEKVAAGERSLEYLESRTEMLIEKHGATSYNKGYKPEWAKTPYPSILCASVNEEAVHAPPAGRYLKDGDIVSFDLGIRFGTACGDAATTVPVGIIHHRKERLIRYTRRALEAGIAAIRDAIPAREVGRTIEKSVLLNGITPVKEYSGHAIGREMHEHPFIPNWDDPKNDEILRAGMVICVEPIMTTGNGKIGHMGSDGWTAFMVDDQPCAQFEEMVLVKKDGHEVLTTHLL